MRGAGRAGSLLIGLLVSGCFASLSEGPPRLYGVEEEMQGIRLSLSGFDLVRFNALDDIGRRKYRDDWVTARMYAIDVQYTGYESALTRERQGVGFGAAAATIGLATGSTLAASTASKDILTSLAGAVTGARAAYENDILFAHSVQWIQTQMRAQRALVSARILRGLTLPITEYTLAAAASDLEEYYRAGTFTAGVLGTTAAVAADAELAKQDKAEVSFVPVAAARGLRACLLRAPKGAARDERRARLVGLMSPPSSFVFAALLLGRSPATAEALLARATDAGICP